MSDDDRVYYVISDLHIGGDEQLEEVEFREELLDFLTRLEQTDENVELVINGDAFGLWEFTTIKGAAKFDRLLESYPGIFDQFCRTGENITISLLPGNHDHELAAYEAYEERLAEYNIDLVSELSMTRKVGDREIYFEHGHQHDANNRIENFGNPAEKPLGYHYNTMVISRAGHLSNRGRFNWLKDIQAVTPTQRIGSWLVSKYYYREMNPILRYASVPILLLFNVSVILVLFAVLDLTGIWSAPVETTQLFFQRFGLAGTAAYMFLWLQVGIAGVLLLVGIPLYFVIRDFRLTIDRFGVFETPLTVDPNEPYEEAARSVFQEKPATAVYCYGHTHRPILREVEDGVMVNTGTWLKRLHRREVITGFLPPVFYPSYQISAVRIEATDEGISVTFEPIDKPSPVAEELTLTERALTLGREPKPTLPDQAIIE